MNTPVNLEQFKNYVNVSLYRMEHSPEYDTFTNELATNAKDSYEFAVYTNRRFEKGEDIISQDIYYSALYARDIIRGHFGEVEHLLTDVQSINSYLRHSGWLQLPDHILDIIKTDAKSIVDYCTWAVKTPIPDAEAIIAKDPRSAFRYAYLWCKPFPLGEEAIASHSVSDAVQYAKYCLKGPFKAAEPLIATSGEASYEYSKIINRRFALGEPALRQLDSEDWKLMEYCRVYKEIRPYSIWHPIRSLFKLLGV